MTVQPRGHEILRKLSEASTLSVYQQRFDKLGKLVRRSSASMGRSSIDLLPAAIAKGLLLIATQEVDTSAVLKHQEVSDNITTLIMPFFKHMERLIGTDCDAFKLTPKAVQVATTVADSGELVLRNLI